MVLKFAVVVLVLLVISFTLSYLSEFSSSGRDIVYNTTGSNQPEQFYEIWLYIGGAVVLILLISTIVYRIKKNNQTKN